MENKAILSPLLAQVMLTLLVWVWMYITRIGTILKSGVDIQDLADDAKGEKILRKVVNPSDNFENLFEMPVLFYVAILVLVVTHLTDQPFIELAWAFVAFRAMHSLIHCTYNRVTHRFTAYFLSSFALWAIWIRILLLSRG